ncbi:4-hydroxy-tetrahydrodipicolinate synthase [Fusobacterium sp. PH5-44]|uniref:4-hydroxy-tetrahydrodipicolinate synthase n=1 Tax=unclassified Fusobacterium TaxID=2648384 RepID=UPI003D1D1661
MEIFRGSGVALVTPFDENENIDYGALDNLITFHLNNSTDALIINGTTGESSTLTDEEKSQVLDYVIKKVNKRIPVIAGTGTNNTKHAIKLSIEAEKLGADALLVVTPYYNKGNESGIYDYYQSIANAIKIPIILYVVPGRTGVNLSIKLLKKLSEIENIVAIKDATGNLSYTAQIAHEVPKLDIYSGNDDVVLPVMSLGGKGVISVSANIIPKETHDMVQSFLDGNIAQATKLQLEKLKLLNTLFIEVNPVPVKEALNILGLSVGPCRSPLGPMEESNRKKLITILNENEVKI